LKESPYITVGILRALNLRDKEFSFDEEEKAAITICPLEVTMHKTQIPTPHIDVKVTLYLCVLLCFTLNAVFILQLFGVEVKLPVSDETLCQAVAMFLGSNMPFYK
jgi:hypothetical protein